MSLSDREKHTYFPALAGGIAVELGDYDANGNLIYQGFFDSRSGQTNGVIFKYTYDASNNWTATSRLVGVSWSTRASLTFP